MSAGPIWSPLGASEYFCECFLVGDGVGWVVRPWLDLFVGPVGPGRDHRIELGEERSCEHALRCTALKQTVACRVLAGCDEVLGIALFGPGASRCDRASGVITSAVISEADLDQLLELEITSADVDGARRVYGWPDTDFYVVP